MLNCKLCDFKSSFRFTMDTHLRELHKLNNSLEYFDDGKPLLVKTPFGIDNSNANYELEETL